jgi:hypothetical protein
MRKALAALAFVAAIFTSAPALAATLKVSIYPGSRNVWFTNVGTDASDPNMVDFSAALLGIRDLGVPSGGTMPAYCIEPEQWLSKESLSNAGESYTPTANENSLVQDLFEAFYFHSLTSVARSAGFQLALWEIVYEIPYEGVPGVRHGRLAFQPEERRDRAARAALLWADYYLRNFVRIAEDSPALTLQWWRSEDSQDLITASRVVDTEPVPLPASLVLLGSALMGLLRFRNRRSAA